jgi:hypothetical protein
MNAACNLKTCPQPVRILKKPIGEEQAILLGISTLEGLKVN